MSTQEKIQSAIADITNFLNSDVNHIYPGSSSCANCLFILDEAYTDDVMDSHCFIHNISHIKLIDFYGGEGKGNEYWSVMEITHKNGTKQHVKLDGNYASYIGAEFTEWFFVKPVEVTVTQFIKDSK